MIKMEKENKEKQQTPTKDVKVKKESSKEVLLALVRIRGEIGISKEIRDTLDMLKLHKRNFCSIYKATPSVVGMVQKAKDYITWGEIDEPVLKKLIETRGQPNPKDNTRTKSFFRLNSPKKGYGRKGIKKPFSTGGALGNRGEKINDLLKRMLY